MPSMWTWSDGFLVLQDQGHKYNRPLQLMTINALYDSQSISLIIYYSLLSIKADLISLSFLQFYCYFVFLPKYTYSTQSLYFTFQAIQFVEVYMFKKLPLCFLPCKKFICYKAMYPILFSIIVSGYTNEIGEAFRQFISRGAVRLTYAVASFYCLSDASSKAYNVKKVKI